MRLADPAEAEAVMARLFQELDDEIPDQSTAVDVLDGWFEWVASEPNRMRVQRAYGAGDPVSEWNGLRAPSTLAYVTPAAMLNSIFGSEFDAANLAFTPEGVVIVMVEPDDQTG